MLRLGKEVVFALKKKRLVRSLDMRVRKGREGGQFRCKKKRGRREFAGSVT